MSLRQKCEDVIDKLITQGVIFAAVMAKVFTTEITSEQIPSDNPIHQRLYKAYVLAESYISGDVLEVGCGEGRGIPLLLGKAKSFTAIDKIAPVVSELQQKYPQGRFRAVNIPPFDGIADNSFDTVVSFQVIEHIKNDRLFLSEIHRVLRPGGVALLTTPNRKMSLTRNPWHIREYLPSELASLASGIFSSVQMRGINGNAKVMAYYEQNRRSVERIARFDILKLQYRLPAALLKLPYEILNRWNRNKLQQGNNALVLDIHHDDYMQVNDPAEALDLFMVATK